MTISELREKLDEAMVQADEEARNSAKTAMNSYRAGYNFGWRDALKTVPNTINGEDGNTLP